MQSPRFFPSIQRTHKVTIAAQMLLVTCCIGAATAQDSVPSGPDTPQPTATLSVTTHEVLLDVVVTDAGRAVSGLKASAFTVLEDGKPQVVSSLEEHSPMAASTILIPALPPNTFSNYTPVANTNAYTVILLDALNTTSGDQMWLRIALIKYLKQMQPGVPTAIFERDTKMHLVQGFTSDPKVLLRAAESERTRPALLKLVRGTKEEYLEYRLDQVSIGFQLLGRYLAAFPGRKNLVWFTGALPGSNALEPMGDPFNDEFKILEGDPHDLTAALTLSRVAVYPVDSRGLEASPQYTAATNRPPPANTTVLFETKQEFQHLALDSIAESTGGRAFYNANGLGEKINEIESNGSHYYTLTYATTNKNWNGEFRHIKIEVNQPHTKLQYRQGYYAVDRSKDEQDQLKNLQSSQQAGTSPGSAGDASAETKGQQPVRQTGQKPAQAPAPEGNAKNPAPLKEGFDEAMQLGAVPPTEIVFVARVSEGAGVQQLAKSDPWPQDNYLAADYKFKPFRTYTVDFTMDAKTLQAVKSPDGMWRGSVAFVSVVYDQTAQNVNSRMTTKNFELDDTLYQDLLEHGLTEHHEIAVPVKGNFFLRLGVHSTTNDRIGALEFAVDQVKPAAGQVAQLP